MPAIFAHNVKTDAGVGATFHIEPNHNPRAGEPTKAWFALTRAGGKIIPLAECDCQLAVYSQTAPEGEKLILEPTLAEITAEQYEGIPGADLVFPEAGAYELRLTGKPKSDGSFQPFQLSYTVNVGKGQAVSPSPTEIASSPGEIETAASSPVAVTQWLIPGVIVVLILGIGIWWWQKSNK
ncbi:MAG: hypothetical protein WA865_10855 [Spirulinaceae cyanobacterium]